MDVILVPFLNLIKAIIGLYQWIVIVHIIMSWLTNFNVINTSNQFVGMITSFLYSATEPVLERIRRFMPDLKGLDLSPLVLIFALMFLSNVLARLVAKLI